MPMYRISRPANPALAETLGTSSGIRGALVSAANPAAAIVAANALALARGFKKRVQVKLIKLPAAGNRQQLVRHLVGE